MSYVEQGQPYQCQHGCSALKWISYQQSGGNMSVTVYDALTGEMRAQTSGPGALPEPMPAQPAAGATVRIELPPGDDVLPDRRNAEAVDRNCLSCHSTETILNQPALSRDVWKAEINKMRTVFGAQIAPDADDDILAYLTTIKGVRRDRWR